MHIHLKLNLLQRKDKIKLTQKLIVSPLFYNYLLTLKARSFSGASTGQNGQKYLDNQILVGVRNDRDAARQVETTDGAVTELVRS
jgi:hypothetical protein